jgi:hypothetical protein
MAELDEVITPSEEGGGLSADVTQDEPVESLLADPDVESDTEE